MTTFDDRENAFEAKFANDEAVQFKVDARANKLLGLWAAEKLGKSDADAYALEVIKSDFEEAGHDDVIRKVVADLGVSDDAEVRAKRREFLNQAKGEVLGDS